MLYDDRNERTSEVEETTSPGEKEPETPPASEPTTEPTDTECDKTAEVPAAEPTIEVATPVEPPPAPPSVPTEAPPATVAEAPTPPPAKPNRVRRLPLKRSFVIPLSAEKKADMFDEVCALDEKLQHLETDKQIAMDGFKKRIAAVEAERLALTDAGKEGHREEVACERVLDYEARTVTVIRLDTGAIVEEPREMTQAEAQDVLGFGDKVDLPVPPEPKPAANGDVWAVRWTSKKSDETGYCSGPDGAAQLFSTKKEALQLGAAQKKSDKEKTFKVERVDRASFAKPEESTAAPAGGDVPDAWVVAFVDTETKAEGVVLGDDNAPRVFGSAFEAAEWCEANRAKYADGTKLTPRPRTEPAPVAPSEAEPLAEAEPPATPPVAPGAVGGFVVRTVSDTGDVGLAEHTKDGVSVVSVYVTRAAAEERAALERVSDLIAETAVDATNWPPNVDAPKAYKAPESWFVQRTDKDGDVSIACDKDGAALVFDTEAQAAEYAKASTPASMTFEVRRGPIGVVGGDDDGTIADADPDEPKAIPSSEPPAAKPKSAKGAKSKGSRVANAKARKAGGKSKKKGR